MPTINSRRKGATGEREAAAAWTAATGLPCSRTAQHRGGPGHADLELPGSCLHLEVKRHARIAAMHALRQAERDAGPGHLPACLLREDGDTRWAVLVRLDDLARLAEELRRLRVQAQPETSQP